MTLDLQARCYLAAWNAGSPIDGGLAQMAHDPLGRGEERARQLLQVASRLGDSQATELLAQLAARA